MRLPTALAGALICRAAALESVPADAFRSVARGRVAVVDDFLARDVVAALRSDAEELWDAGLYSAPTRDTKLKRRNERFVLRGSVWRDFGVGRGTARSRVAATMDKVRDACAARLGRADLQRTPPARHEFSYTRFAPGASLARHVDEHHEETKGTEGWRAPTRRSVTWLVYLNERDVAGGRLRAYERRRPIAGDAQVLRPASFFLFCAAMACGRRRRALDADATDDAIDAAPARRWAPRPTATCRSAGSGPPRPTPWNGPCSWRRGSTTRRATARCASATPSCRGRSTRRRRST